MSDETYSSSQAGTSSGAFRIARELQTAVADLFSVHDVTLGIPGQADAIRLRGRLQVASNRAYPQIADRLRELGYTPALRHDPAPDRRRDPVGATERPRGRRGRFGNNSVPCGQAVVP